jgi:hypothetical protein
MSGVPVPEKRNSANSLENFARNIEEMFRKGKDQGPFALQRQVCRLMASKDLKVAAAMTAKWVEWRFGKATENVKLSGTLTHEHMDLSGLSDEQLRQVEQIVESAVTPGNKG